MLATLIERRGDVAVREISEPVMGDYDARCELLYGATCTGTDGHIIDGTFPWIGSLPTVLGHESIGRVIAIGPKVRNYRVGDLVTRVGTPACPNGAFSVTWGGFTQQGIARDHWAMAAAGLPQGEWAGHRVNQILPAAIDPRVGPMFITWRETLSYLLRLGAKAGQRVLVVGSGGNGLSFAAHGVNLGAEVTLVGAARLAGAARAKARVHAFFDYKQPNLEAELSKATPAGFDLIIDAIGRTGLADQFLPCLRVGGTYAIYGLDDVGKTTLNPGKARGAFTVKCGGEYDEAETHAQVCDYVLRNKLDASLWYDLEHPFALSNIAGAFEAVRNRRMPKALIDLRR